MSAEPSWGLLTGKKALWSADCHRRLALGVCGAAVLMHNKACLQARTYMALDFDILCEKNCMGYSHSVHVWPAVRWAEVCHDLEQASQAVLLWNVSHACLNIMGLCLPI